MKKLIVTGILMVMMLGSVQAQEQLNIKQQADRLYDRYEYYKSLQYYLKLADHNPNIKLIERIAGCYREINDYENAEAWYAKAVADVKASKTSHYFYAGALLRNKKFDLAKEQYRLYYAEGSRDLNIKLATCDSAITWMREASPYKVNNAGDLNTPYSDWGMSYAGKNSFIFTSDRLTGDGVDDRTNNDWFKLYQFDAVIKQIKQLYLNSGDFRDFEGGYHIGPVALNKTADTAYITVTTEIASKKLPLDKRDGQKLYTRRLQLLPAVKKNEQWVVFGSFPYNKVQDYSIGSATLSANGKLIYFSSDMPGGFGKTDLWYCEKRFDGTWGRPVNCGKTINTTEEENFPFVSDDGTLYYASKGLPGMGGYDIYSAKGEKSNWSTPRNLKYPVNSTSDDFYFVSKDGLNGYLSSNREDGKGSDDVYAFTYVSPPQKTKPVAAEPNASTPDFFVKTIYYDLDKYNIRPDAAAEMDKLIVILKRYRAYKVIVSSYTDSRANYEYNLKLSQNRARAATDYLIEHGIPSARIMAGGYGKTNLVNNCPDGVNCTEAEHQANRRTEFRLFEP